MPKTPFLYPVSCSWETAEAMWVNNSPKVATQWNSGATRESNPGPRAQIPSTLTTKVNHWATINQSAITNINIDITLGSPVKQATELELQKYQCLCRHVMRPSAWSCATVTLTFDLWPSELRIATPVTTAWQTLKPILVFRQPFVSELGARSTGQTVEPTSDA